MPVFAPVSNANVQKLSRKDLITWVNQILSTNYEKIEEMSTGVGYCRLLDTLIPGSVTIKRVKSNPKLENDYIHNFRLFQSAFSKNGIDKNIPIEKLVKGKFQDNFEFLQWFQKFYDTNSNGQQNLQQNVLREDNKPQSDNKNQRQLNKTVSRPSVTNEMMVTSTGVLKPYNNSRSNSVSPSSSDIVSTKERGELLKQIATLTEERDLYYNKIKEIEVLLATQNDTNVIIHKIRNVVSEVLTKHETSTTNKKRRVSFKGSDDLSDI